MTMFCPDEEKLSAWVDRSLAPLEDESVSTHLGACESCRRAVTIAFLIDRESPEALTDDGQERVLQVVQGALAEPSHCVTDEQLAAWLHDGLAPAERAKVTEHLSECEDCRRAAALARLSNSEPVSALGEVQEKRALKVVLRSVGRDTFFTFWRVAAASLLVAIAVTYSAIQWMPKGHAPTTASAPVENSDRTGLGHVNSGNGSSDPAAMLSSPNIGTAPKSIVPPPENKATEPAAPAWAQPLPILESEGLDSAGPGRLSYADVLRPKDVASVNIEGKALAVLDKCSVSRIAYAADPGAYVVEVTRGRVFIDTAGGKQTWEIRAADRAVTLRSFQGRASAEADGSALRIHILRGAADVGPHAVEANRRIEVMADSSVTIEQWPEACEHLAQRYAQIRPRSLLVMRAAAGATSNDGPWRYSSPSSKAEPLAGGGVIPECDDLIRWVVISLDEPLKFSSDMELRAAVGGTGTKLYLWVGGSGGWHREVDRQSGGMAPKVWSLRSLRRDMVDLVAGEELRKIMIGVVQERGREYTLEVGGIEIRRNLD